MWYQILVDIASLYIHNITNLFIKKTELIPLDYSWFIAPILFRLLLDICANQYLPPF